MAPDHDDHSSLNPEAEVAASLVGMVLADRYRVERVIGIGGVGTVFRATQIGLERRVAIKVLRPELTQNPTAMERFAREARTAAALQHPNIVTVHDFGTTIEGRAYLVMEFIKGLNLAQWIRRNRPTDAAAAAVFLADVCAAVGVLHDAGIIHRDIKPSNIMITEGTGGRSVVKVVDFGLVRPNLGEDPTDLTGGLVLGTPEFMAPELFTGTRPDVRSDVYALGVTAYETLTGELPFGTGTFREMYNRHTQSTPVRPSEARPDLPVGVDELVFRALNKHPNRRYATAAEFGEAITATFAGRAPAPRPSQPVVAPAPRPPDTETPLDECVTRIGAILVGEDDRPVRDQICTALRRHGFEVTEASDGIEAFLLLGNRVFDAIVSDVAMPNLDGMALLRLLSEKGIRTPVVLLTGTLSERDQQLGHELGAASIVHKPVDVDVLAVEVRAALGYLEQGRDGQGI
jgi:serine/threonine-protein kinase